MGHYASEMSPPVRHDPEVLKRRRSEARKHAEFVWELYQKYEDQGVWIDTGKKLTCPYCFAKVEAILRLDHDSVCTVRAR